MSRHNAVIEIDLAYARERYEQALEREDHWAAWDAKADMTRLELELRNK